MNSMIGCIVGYLLLLFNCVLLVISVKKKCNQTTLSSFYILSISDILISILTAILLIVNHTRLITESNYTYQNNILNKTDMTLNLNSEKESNYYDIFHQITIKNNSLNESNMNPVLLCSTTNLLMYYGMFIIPFTNAFLSLLTFSMQCNFNTKYINNKCYELFQIKTNANKNETRNIDIDIKQVKDIRLHRKSMMEDENNIQRDIPCIRGIDSTILNTFQDIRLKRFNRKEQRIQSILLLNQWFIPILITGILYFAEYFDITATTYEENTECMLELNFPFHNYFESNENIILFNDLNSKNIMMPKYNGYFDTKNSIKIFNPNVTETEVVNKVYEFIQSILNDTYNVLKPTNTTYSYNNSNALNMINNTASSKKRKYNLNQYLSLDVFNPDKYKTSQNEETELKNKPLLILPDILKERSQYLNLSLKENNLYNNENQSIYPSNIKTVFQNRGHNIVKISQQIQNISSNLKENRLMHMIDTCSISIKFLRVYFLFFIFIMYIFPILSSFVLQMKSKYIYKNILDKVKKKDGKIPGTLKLNLEKTMYNSTNAKDTKTNQEACTSWFSESYKEKDQETSKQTNKLSHNLCSSKSYNKKHDNEIDQNQLLIFIKKKIHHLQNILEVNRISLTVCILLWTPIFFQILLEVFLCMHIPKWIFNSTYLCAISHTALRNIFNLKMIDAEETCFKINKKENVIYPSEQNII